jgi:hypothetical protein
MSQYSLTNINGTREITLKFEAESLDVILPNIEEFLRGCGFYLTDQSLQLVSENDFDCPGGCHDHHLPEEPARTGWHQEWVPDTESPWRPAQDQFWAEQEPDFPPIPLHVDSEGGIE